MPRMAAGRERLVSRSPCSRCQGTAPVARLAMTESFAWEDSADIRESHDQAETADSDENSESTEPKEPTEPTDRNEPAEPMESTESVDAIERSEFREPRESREVMRTVCALTPRPASCVGQSKRLVEAASLRPRR